LYKVTLSNEGAVAKSWIITRDKNGRELFSVGVTKEKPKPDLELINPDGAKFGEYPLRVQIAGADKNDQRNILLRSRNYEIKSVRVNNEVIELKDDRLEIQQGNSATIEFLMSVEYSLDGKKTKLEVSKTLTFYSDDYTADIQVNLKQSASTTGQGGETVVETRPVHLLIGPSIGDQGIPAYSFYSVPPEGIAAVGEDVERYYGVTINQQHSDRLNVPGVVEWAGVGDTYFGMVAVPSARAQGAELQFTTAMIEHTSSVADGVKQSEPRYLITAYVPVPADGSFTRLYVGPKDHYLLKQGSANVSAAVNRPVDLEGMIDYGFMSWMSRPLAVPILWCIKFLYRITGSYGIAIILFTIVIYSLFFPLKWRSSKAMKKAQKLAPRMKELQEKIKGMKKTDPRLKELQIEQMRLMKEGNPLGGCLPLLIQMPFLFALYRAITISIDFRQASFLWIPDLSAPEPTIIHILPILMAGSMMVLQLITPAPTADPMQRKLMAIGMPLLMLWMLWTAPAGLLVYWLVGNVVGFAQQFVINRLTATEDDQQPPSGKKVESRTTKKLKPRVSQT
jgi:YidC/Oxa1 family membrane protein insertase